MQSIENAGFRIGKLVDKRKLDDSHPFGVMYQLVQTLTLAVMSETTVLLSRLSEKRRGTTMAGIAQHRDEMPERGGGSGAS